MSKIDTKALRSRVELINNLPTIPMVLKRLLSIVENPSVSLIFDSCPKGHFSNPL